jgi:hypothetical protein
MRRPSHRFTLFLVTLLVSVPGAAQLVPLGLEVRVDDDRSVPDPAECPQVSAAPNGGFLVSWTPAQEERGGECRPDGAVFGRFFDPQGQPRTEHPAVVVTAEGNCIDELRVGPFVDGRVTSVWRESFGLLDPFSMLAGAWFSALGDFGNLPLLPQDGTPAGTLASGGFVFTFVRGRQAGFDAERYDRFGELVGKRFTVSRSTGPLFEVAAAETSDGGLVVVWIGGRPKGKPPAVFGRRFDLKGRALGPELTLSDATSVPNPVRDVLAAASGVDTFMAAWSGGAQDSDALVRVFANDGRPLTPVLHANTNQAGEEIASSLVAAKNGDFVLAWQRLHRPLQSFEVVARLFAPDGTLLGPAVPLPSDKAGFQYCGELTTDHRGNWMTAWLGDGPQGQGLYLRRFHGASTPPSP